MGTAALSVAGSQQLKQNRPPSEGVSAVLKDTPSFDFLYLLQKGTQIPESRAPQPRKSSTHLRMEIALFIRFHHGRLGRNLKEYGIWF